MFTYIFIFSHMYKHTYIALKILCQEHLHIASHAICLSQKMVASRELDVYMSAFRDLKKKAQIV